MSSINDGGPAFPISIPGFGDNGASGATLRDYFAAKAMPQWFGTGTPETRAAAAYRDADAMLKAREVQP